MDMCNFGPKDTVPQRFAGRTLYEHNAAVTLMRTTEAECAELGRIIARKLDAATGPVSVFIPLAGVSAIDRPGAPFHDPAADAALVRELRAGLRPGIEVVEMGTDINDPAFAIAMAERLDELHLAWSRRHPAPVTRPATPPARPVASARPRADDPRRRWGPPRENGTSTASLAGRRRARTEGPAEPGR
jgi:hypothetical protein